MISNTENVDEPFEGKKTESIREQKSDISDDEDEQSDLLIDGPVEGQEITREQLSLRKKLFNWRTILPLVVVVAAFIIFVLPNVNLQKTWSVIRNANLLFWMVAFVVYYLTFPLRAFRWRILLENVGFTEDRGAKLPPFWKLVEIVYISFFANAIVPAKLGDMYRAYLLSQETGKSATRSFGTVLAERLLDLIVLLLLCIPAVLISLRDRLPWQVELVLTLTLSAVIIGVIGLFLLRLLRTKIGAFVPERFRDQYNHLHEGMLGSFRRLPILFITTLGTWVGEAMRFFFVALALNLFNGSLLHIVSAAFFIGLVEALLTVIPATGGGLGIVEGGMTAMILLLQPSNPQAVSALTAAAIVLDRSISYFSILIIGSVIFMIAFGRHARKQIYKS